MQIYVTNVEATAMANRRTLPEPAGDLPVRTARTARAWQLHFTCNGLKLKCLLHTVSVIGLIYGRYLQVRLPGS